MLSYEEFKQEITGHIKEHLPEKFMHADVRLQTITKNNNNPLDALIIKIADGGAVPAIYLNYFYEDYKNGADLYEILNECADYRVRYNEPDIDVSYIDDFSQVKGHIIPKLVNTEMNGKMLAKSPHTDIEDLSVIYQIVINQDDFGRATVTIDNGLMHSYGVTAEELHNISVSNMETCNPAEFITIEDIIIQTIADEMFDGDIETAKRVASDDIGMPEDCGMYVITSSDRINGAAAVLSCRLMDIVRETLGEDIVILPSSIHEMIVVSGETAGDVKYLKALVKLVNGEQVRPEEQLSDNVYKYNFKEHKLVAAVDTPEITQNAEPAKPIFEQTHDTEPHKAASKKAKHR